MPKKAGLLPVTRQGLLLPSPPPLPRLPRGEGVRDGPGTLREGPPPLVPSSLSPLGKHPLLRHVAALGTPSMLAQPGEKKTKKHGRNVTSESP